MGLMRGGGHQFGINFRYAPISGQQEVLRVSTTHPRGVKPLKTEELILKRLATVCRLANFGTCE